MQSIGGVLDSRATLNNDNVNNIYINNNDNVKIQQKFEKSRKVETIAKKLVDTFDNPDSYRYYCMIAYKLPENVIWNHVESAMTGRNPSKLFTWLCTRSLNGRC